MKLNAFICGLNVSGQPCWVIGTGAEADDKTKKLTACGATVTVVEPDSFDLNDLADQFLVVFCPQDDTSRTRAVFERCREKRILLCAIDQPDYCDVVNVSVVQKGHLKIAVSTSGVAPSAAKKIRQGLETSLDSVPVEAYFDFLAAERRRLEREISDKTKRRKKLVELIQGFEFKAELTLPGQ